MKTIKIAIDGPAGAGKSTVAKSAAKKLGFVYVDTGAMYRAVGLSVLRSGYSPKDENAVMSVAEKTEIDIRYKNGEQNIYLNGENVTKDIRTPEVSVAASDVAVVGGVRKRLVELQRELAMRENVIMDGRDIGTRVLPNADVKIFLTASAEERATRRFKELCEKKTECSFEEVLRDIKYRDKNDSERAIDPLKPAEDSIIIDTTGLNFEESENLIINEVNKKINSGENK